MSHQYKFETKYQYEKKNEEILVVGTQTYKIVDGKHVYKKTEEPLICFGHPPFPTKTVWIPVFTNIRSLRQKAKRWNQLYFNALVKL